LNGCNGKPCRYHFTDGFVLAGSMVEFQHNWISFATFHARMSRQVTPNVISGKVAHFMLAGCYVGEMSLLVFFVPCLTEGFMAISAGGVTDAQRLISVVELLFIFPL
jgi:hypothetical protein